jgi:hypothetical protein
LRVQQILPLVAETDFSGDFQPFHGVVGSIESRNGMLRRARVNRYHGTRYQHRDGVEDEGTRNPVSLSMSTFLVLLLLLSLFQIDALVGMRSISITLS